MFDGGRALQRVWLTATSLGFYIQPMTAIVCLFWRLLDGAEDLPKKSAKLLERLRQEYVDVFKLREGQCEVMMFRLARADEPSAHSLRLRTEDVLRIIS